MLSDTTTTTNSFTCLQSNLWALYKYKFICNMLTLWFCMQLCINICIFIYLCVYISPLWLAWNNPTATSNIILHICYIFSLLCAESGGCRNPKTRNRNFIENSWQAAERSRTNYISQQCSGACAIATAAVECNCVVLPNADIHTYAYLVYACTCIYI